MSIMIILYETILLPFLPFLLPLLSLPLLLSFLLLLHLLRLRLLLEPPEGGVTV
jgi:hypothetical protein